MTGAQFVGFLPLSRWIPALSERLGERRILLGSQLASAGIATALAFLLVHGSLTYRGLMVGAMAIGIAYTFALPVKTMLTPQLVPPEDAAAALAMNALSYGAGWTLAPVLCIPIFATIGVAWAFALDAFSFILLTIIILKLRPRVAATPVRKSSHAKRCADRCNSASPIVAHVGDGSRHEHGE